MPSQGGNLVLQAAQALNLNQRQFAEFMGISVRTVQRNPASCGLTLTTHYQKLIQAVHPLNPELAQQLAASIRMTLPALGIQPPAPPPAPPPPPLARREHADSIVCAAADVLQISPQNARPIVAAVFTRALELGVNLPSLARLVATPATSKT